MSKAIAVTSSEIAEQYGALKRALLLFDQIAVVPRKAGDKDVPAELWWLRDRGLVVNALEPFVADGETVFSLGDVRFDDAKRELFQGRRSVTLLELLLRSVATFLAKKTGWVAVSFGWDTRSASRILPAGQSRAIEVVLRALPEPDELTPWDAILEWRSDAETQIYRRRLKRWIANVARMEANAKDLQDEVEYLLDEYRQHIHLHQLKAGSGVLKTVVVTSADVAAKLATLKWGDAAKALFFVREHRIALLEAERSAPGREIAYIAEAQKRFA